MIMLLSSVTYVSASGIDDTDDIGVELLKQSTFIEKTADGGYLFVCDSAPSVLRSTNNNNFRATVIVYDTENTGVWDSVTRSDGGHRYESAWDSSKGVMLYTYVYYTYPSGSTTKLTHVQGGYSISDSTIRVTNQILTMGAIDPAHTGQQATYSVSGASWTKYAPSSWSAIDTGQTILACLGCNYSATLTRNSESWGVSVKNNPVENISSPW